MIHLAAIGVVALCGYAIFLPLHFASRRRRVGAKLVGLANAMFAVLGMAAVIAVMGFSVWPAILGITISAAAGFAGGAIASLAGAFRGPNGSRALD